MKTMVSKYMVLAVLMIVGFGSYCQADTETKPQKGDVKKEMKKEVTEEKASSSKKNEDLPILKLEIDKSAGKSNDPKLKSGKGCENLEEVKGETFDDYPEAKTVPCTEVDCKDLKPAKLKDNNYKELPDAKTDTSCEE